MSPERIVELAQQNDYTYIGAADSNTINALPNLSVACQEAKLPFLFGVTFTVVDDLDWRKPKKDEKKTTNAFWCPTVYIANQQGFYDVMNLLSVANQDDHFYFQPQIALSELIETFNAGNVIVTSGSLHSVFSHKSAHAIVVEFTRAQNAQNFVIELVPVDTQYFTQHNARAIKAATQHGIVTVLSRPVLHDKNGNQIRNTMNCIMKNDKVDSMWRNEPASDLTFLTSTQRAAQLERAANNLIQSGMDRYAAEQAFNSADVYTMALVNRCTFHWQKMDVCLPKMSSDPFMALLSLCKEGWKHRISKSVLGYAPEPAKLPEYHARLKYELSVIKSMGFSDYFLLVNEIVSWCKENDLVVGPGRGSVGGSLIAFLLGITDVDPIRFNLFFERFINPERLDLPDIDLDFMSSRRNEVIEYLSKRFGEEYVAGITNYSVLGSSSALRSVAKAHGLKDHEYACSKLVPKEHGQSMGLQEALIEPQIEAFSIRYPEIWQEACALQGAFRAYGQHAAGFIVAGEPIFNRAVVEYRKNSKVVNWDKRLVEDFGLIKLDILGLTTLDVLAYAKAYIKERTGKEIEYLSIPLDDKKVLEAFGEGKTTGVFQFEKGNAKRLLKEARKGGELSFDDIVAITALNRPGPLEAGLTEKWIRIKQGNDLPSYIHESMEPALEKTYSVIVYQEQVMQVARDLAGFTMAEADHLRKAMGKKDAAKIAKLRDKFVEGAKTTSQISNYDADLLFSQIEKFAGYAFNLSHSVEYTVISYWAMYLKVYHPEVFYAATMTVLGDTTLTKDADKNDVVVMPPDINKSSDRFEIHYHPQYGKDVLYAPFQVIKGLSANAAAAILRAKTAHGRSFKSKQEFVDSVERRLCNKRGQQALDDVGAFAEIEPGQLPARHPDRLKAQKLLMPDIAIEAVKAERAIQVDAFITGELKGLIEETNTCDQCSLAGKCHPSPRLGRSAKMMLVMDCPNWSDEDAGKMGEGKANDYLRAAIKNAGLSYRDVYITSLVKAPKDKGGQLENEMIIGCQDYLKREIDLLKPPVIVTLGSKTARHLVPELEGGWEDILLTDHYNKDMDATILIGMNPMMVHMDKDKQDRLNAVFEAAAHLIS